MPKSKTFFITATDTGVGKTITSLVLGTLLQSKGFDVGAFKPVQCAGRDASFLKKSLGLQDDLNLINPFYAPEALSPHLAFRRARIKFDKRKVQAYLKLLQARHDIVLVEGAGGLMVPLTNSYFNADLIEDLKAPVIIVARQGIGTINHTLLTIREIQRRKLTIKGLVFCQTKTAKKGLPENSNPSEIKKISGIMVLGIIPYLKPLTQENILKQCQHLTLDV